MDNNKTAGRGLALWGFIFGLVGLVLCFLFFIAPSEAWVLTFPIIGLVLGIIGMILCAAARRRGYKSGLRILGIILSLLAIIAGIIFIILCALVLGEIIEMY